MADAINDAGQVVGAGTFSGRPSDADGSDLAIGSKPAGADSQRESEDRRADLWTPCTPIATKPVCRVGSGQWAVRVSDLALSRRRLRMFATRFARTRTVH